MHDLAARLKALGEEEYRRFNESLLPGWEGRSFGVRMGALRKLAKEILREDWRSFLQDAPVSMHEHILLKCLVTASAPCELEEKLTLVEPLLLILGNWAQCDCLCSAFKGARKDPERVYTFLLPLFQREEIYVLRFAIVMLLEYYRTDVYIDRVLTHLRSIRHEAYYVRMAQAWALSFCFVSHREKTLALLKEQSLDAWVQNKTIQKCRESFKVSPADKEALRMLRMEN